MSHSVLSSMCQRHFGLTEAPFSIAPDPRYLFMSRSHQEALATLVYGLSGEGGFVLLTGDVGAGKTTVCRCLLEQIPEACDVAYIFNPKLTVVELLSTICDEFGVAYPRGNSSIKLFVDLLNFYLLDAHGKGRRAVLIIDEAQNLSADVLEQIRLLTNLETNQRKLLQIILLGQPELAAMLERPELRQLAQRIVARYHLGPLGKAEVGAYVQHRLEVSGATRPLFPASLMGKLYSLTGGVPRVINTACDRALLGAYVQGMDHVDRATLAQAAREVFARPKSPTGSRVPALLAALGMTAVAALVVTLYQHDWPVGGPGDVSASVAQAAPPVAPATGGPVSNREPRPVLPATLEWPAALPVTNSRALAEAALLRAWGIDNRAATGMCDQAATAGLNCRAGVTGLDGLRFLNRPAILEMHDGRGQPFSATLTRLDDHSATLVVGNEPVTVPLSVLAYQWSGRYQTLWRPSPYAGRNILPGDDGPAVEWLSRALGTAEGEPSGGTVERSFNHDLMRRIKKFQLAQGLVPDGIAGPQTLARLGAVADRTAPKLFE